MNQLLYPHKLPRLFYRAFIQDCQRLYKLLPPKLRFSFWAVLFIQFIAAITETCTLLVISFFAVSVASPDTARNNFLVKPFLEMIPALNTWLLDHSHLVIFSSLMMAFFILFKTALNCLASHKATVFAESVSLHIGQETLGRYLGKSYFWHISPAGPDVFHKFNLRGQLSGFLVAILMLYSYTLCCLALFTSLFLFEPQLTLVVISTFSLASLSTYLFLRRRLDQAGQKSALLSQAESVERQALIEGLREVILYRREGFFFKKMVSFMEEAKPLRAFQAFSNHLPSYVLEVIGFSTVALVTVFRLLWGVPMPVIISSTSILMLTAWRVLPAVNRTLNCVITIRNQRSAALASLEILENFIAEDPEPLPEPDPAFHFEKTLLLDKITFSYPGAPKAALNNLNLSIGKGERIGLIGSSGAGKSTLALLLSGLVNPAGGRFLVDAKALSPGGRAAYVRLVGFVPQTPLLLAGTVADNVAFSQWGEKYDRQRVEEACRQAALDFIFEHPRGLDMPLGSGGRGLSGGQAQRVAIARALFTRPQIIIFDEATSALDQASENIITETINTLKRDTTVIIIAHRLSTVENCDRLIWLEEGHIRAEGTPVEMLPLYRQAMAGKSKE